MSLAGVITVCIGGVATHHLQAIQFVSRFIPAEPGPSLSIVLCLVSIGGIVCIVPVWVPLCMVAGLIFDVPEGTLSVMIGRYFCRVPIRDSLFDGDAFACRFMWISSTRTDSWHSDSPRRHSCLSTETGTVASFSPWRCLRFSFRQRDGHFCLATETGTMAFLAVASGGTSDSVHRQCGRHSCLAPESSHSGFQFMFLRGLFHFSRSKQRHSLSQVRHISPFLQQVQTHLPSKCHEICTGNP